MTADEAEAPPTSDQGKLQHASCTTERQAGGEGRHESGAPDDRTHSVRIWPKTRVGYNGPLGTSAPWYCSCRRKKIRGGVRTGRRERGGRGKGAGDILLAVAGELGVEELLGNCC
ncbi:hypothetical protein ZWY2020_052801 [Hordeum vulgare]|nr:hypothetical protein ZWY2020_052801 [Hordeum vulgare]